MEKQLHSITEKWILHATVDMVITIIHEKSEEIIIIISKVDFNASLWIPMLLVYLRYVLQNVFIYVAWLFLLV